MNGLSRNMALVELKRKIVRSLATTINVCERNIYWTVKRWIKKYTHTHNHAHKIVIEPMKSVRQVGKGLWWDGLIMVCYQLLTEVQLLESSCTPLSLHE